MKRWIALLLIPLLLAATAFPQAAAAAALSTAEATGEANVAENASAAEEAVAANTPKEEVVYATLTPEGSVQSVTVINGFHLEQAGTILDYGDYQRVANLTSLAALQQEDGCITAEVEAGDFYYQG